MARPSGLPTLRALLRDGGLSQKANPKLKPEKIQTYELLWEQSLNKNLKLTTTAFYYRINDLINTVTDPADGLIVVRNTGKVAAKGVEMELAGRWVNRLEGRLSYSLQEARDLDTGRLLSNSPRHLVKLNLTGPSIRTSSLAAWRCSTPAPSSLSPAAR